MLTLREIVPAPVAGALDPAAAWAALTPAQQASIGVPAIVHALGSLASKSNRWREPVWQAADIEGALALEDNVLSLLVGDAGELPRPDLTRIGVRTCRWCGCTDNVGCEEGCCWVSEDMCSACVPQGRG